MSVKEIQDKIVSTMARWQKVEDASVASTGRVIAKTSNPLVRLIMEIIQADSQMHHRVQGIIADSAGGGSVAISPDELLEVWDMIENHIKIEKQTIELAEELLGAIQGKKLVVAEYLLNYLAQDERKHDALLADLERIKKGLYP